MNETVCVTALKDGPSTGTPYKSFSKLKSCGQAAIKAQTLDWRVLPQSNIVIGSCPIPATSSKASSSASSRIVAKVKRHIVMNQTLFTVVDYEKLFQSFVLCLSL